MIDYEDQTIIDCAKGLVNKTDDEIIKVKSVYEVVYTQPSVNVIAVLKSSRTLDELAANLPAEF